MSNRFEHILSPIKIGNMILKNRIVSTPCYGVAIKAKGGAALVIEGCINVGSEKSFWDKDTPYSFSKNELAKRKEQVNNAHFYGAKIGAELFHAGMWCRVSKDDFAYGPCDTYLEEYDRHIKGLDQKEMDDICKAFANSAKDAKECGYDEIFLHFGHGWLVSSFLSPIWNKREDEYGGSIENRAKFPLAIIKAVREAVGPMFPIEMRINGADRLEGSISLEDVTKFCQMASEYLDIIQISSGHDMIRDGNVHMASTNLLPRNYNVPLAVEIKKHVKNCLVYAVGAIQNMDEAEELLKTGKVDLIGLGRELIADPELPHKLMEDRPEDIRPCLRCNYCYHIATNRRNQGCSVNPTIIRDVPKELVECKNKKKVVVVGGGPAGIIAALTADEVGHDVTLIEKENEVGGLLRYISKEHFKDEYKKYLSYLNTQLNKSNVKLMLNTNADKDLISSLDPDRLIIAIGGKLLNPKIEGVENALNCLEAIEHPEKIGDKVTIIGGGVVGLELALGLSLVENKKVTVIEATNTIVGTANELYKVAFKQKIDEAKDNLTILKKSKCVSIGKDRVTIESNGKTKIISTDTTIVAIGIRAKTDEAFNLYNIVPDTVMAGDCVASRVILEATFEGYSAGNKE